MSKRDEHFELVGYVMGILSIVFSVLLQPAFGLGFGITGLVLVAKMKSEDARKARKLAIIGVAISAVLMAIGVYFFVNQLGGSLSNPLV